LKIYVTGSVAFDQVMTMPGKFCDYIQPDKLHILNVSFLMDTFSRHFGGTAGNQAYTLALLGFKPYLVACVGSDFGTYKNHLAKAGVDLKFVKKIKDKTATGFAMTDKDNNQLWGFYTGAMKRSAGLSLSGVLKPEDWLIISPNDPQAMVRYLSEAKKSHCRYLFDPAFQIPRLPQEVLKAGILNSKIVIGNDYEIGLLVKYSGLTQGQMVDKGAVLISTAGAKGSFIMTANERLLIPRADAKGNVDPTGAGDAYRAGFLAGFIKNLPLETCGKMGALCAVYTVERFGTQTHHFGLTAFKKRYKQNFKEALNEL
jgi:adenosine kinase